MRTKSFFNDISGVSQTRSGGAEVIRERPNITLDRSESCKLGGGRVES